MSISLDARLLGLAMMFRVVEALNMILLLVSGSEVVMRPQATQECGLQKNANALFWETSDAIYRGPRCKNRKTLNKPCG
jgi:hypothetical protein